MMNDSEESDPALVTMNLANKAGSPAAEQGEPRAGAKGKADLNSTGRAQDRESVSHVGPHPASRKAQDEGEKPALFHHIDPEALRTALSPSSVRPLPGWMR